MGVGVSVGKEEGVGECGLRVREWARKTVWVRLTLHTPTVYNLTNQPMNQSVKFTLHASTLCTIMLTAKLQRKEEVALTQSVSRGGERRCTQSISQPVTHPRHVEERGSCSTAPD